ncbi:SDR family NAD(P)-dependent oxidoreductase [uncultured Litoreibacter sp.]|uniref:SDR family NAD(P)-dependent oxidoreductase n=1 Tax=uncultured Litoreibacter sp. TaxID=1392394 RepID=UPI002603CFEC|nr:SDR family NAD(P)-dependent oxidoreductase [uncultured Litoreibacter sp.]
MILKDKTVLVTGASRGIGAALAKGMAEAGADIVITDLEHEADAMAAVAGQVEAAGRRAMCIPIDVTNKARVEEVVAEATAEMGQIDVLVNNAGVLKLSRLDALDEATWDQHFDVNAKGIMLCTNAILPQMKERGTGRIVNIASLAGRQGIEQQGHYAATKATAITLTRVYAQELGNQGIYVNALCPGIIMTEMGQNNLQKQEDRDYWAGATALGRLGEPEDIVGPAVFFASDLSGFVTGQALNVCGGLYFH